MQALRLCAPGLAVLGLACASPGEAEWKTDWNARVDAAQELSERPCGDFVFDAWADEFLEQCNDPSPELEDECRDRMEWVWDRSNQCASWQDWLLRNHNRRERRDDLKEPETRVR